MQLLFCDEEVTGVSHLDLIQDIPPEVPDGGDGTGGQLSEGIPSSDAGLSPIPEDSQENRASLDSLSAYLLN